jgi:hypothetical protein
MVRALNFVRPDSSQLLAALCALVCSHHREPIDPVIIDPTIKDCRVSFRRQFTENGFQQRYESHGVVGREPLNRLEPDDGVEGGIDCRCIHLGE